ncbi:ATP-binding region, ATPase-like domain protein, partial [mine drainage metagenome]
HYALHYTPPGGTVTLGVAVRDGEMRIYVRDSGPGIPTGELPFVMDRFYRGTAGRAAGSGSGLGLAIASAVTGSLGGRLELECPPEGGTIAILAFTTRNQLVIENSSSATSAVTS